jgi:nitrogen-specific signal transduction histidine kinase
VDGCTVIVFDADGLVRSATSGAAALLGSGELRSGASLDDAFAGAPTLRQWIALAADRARASGAGDSCVLLGDGGPAVQVCLAPIAGGDGFALVASPSEPPSVDAESVSQRAWHDIKNQLGGLKLYATFLKMRLGAQDELVRETSEKIVSGIDAIVRSIAEVRRGADKTRGEEA